MSPVRGFRSPESPDASVLHVSLAYLVEFRNVSCNPCIAGVFDIFVIQKFDVFVATQLIADHRQDTAQACTRGRVSFAVSGKQYQLHNLTAVYKHRINKKQNKVTSNHSIKVHKGYWSCVNA